MTQLAQLKEIGYNKIRMGTRVYKVIGFPEKKSKKVSVSYDKERVILQQILPVLNPDSITTTFDHIGRIVYWGRTRVVFCSNK